MTEQEEKQAIKEVLFDYNAETIEFADEIADKILQKLNKLRKPSEPDWEQRRYEIANALYASSETIGAKAAVSYADLLITELKKQKQ